MNDFDGWVPPMENEVMIRGLSPLEVLVLFALELGVAALVLSLLWWLGVFRP